MLLREASPATLAVDNSANADPLSHSARDYHDSEYCDYDDEEYYYNYTEVPNYPADTTIVDLDGNEITELKADSFGNLTKCTALYLGINKISQIDHHTFHGMSNLKHLSLEDNYQSVIKPGTFSNLHKLTYLWLNDNEISEINLEMLEGLKAVIEF